VVCGLEGLSRGDEWVITDCVVVQSGFMKNESYSSVSDLTCFQYKVLFIAETFEQVNRLL
jgi:hypothetical protein